MPIQPVFASAIYIRILASLLSRTEQQDYLRSGNRIINSVSGTNVDTQLPNSIAAKLMIAKVVQLHAVDSSVNRDLRPCVTKPATPFNEGVFPTARQVMANLVHN